MPRNKNRTRLTPVADLAPHTPVRRDVQETTEAGWFLVGGDRDGHLSDVEPDRAEVLKVLLVHRRENPSRGIRPFREPPRGRYVSQEEIEQLLDAASESKSKYMLPLIQLALHAGMQRWEFLGLRWEQID